MDYGCIGEVLTHSFSKTIHEKIGDYNYILKEISKNDLDTFMKKKDFLGINVTIPYKVSVMPYLDNIEDNAKEIGAVNTIVNKNNKLTGYNTDFSGLKTIIEKAGIDIYNKKVAVLGTGGTSNTAYAVLKYLKAKEIIKVSRSKKDNTVTYDTLYKNHKEIDVIINTTPVGMYKDFKNMPLNIEYFNNLEGVVDVIYNPLLTRLLYEAKKKNIKTAGGLMMLVSQAVFASEKFTGKKIEKETTDKIYNDIRKEKQNIVLTGMPGCGKTTVGKILAEKLNKNFIDTDDLILKKYNKTPNEIIKEKGEDYFRLLESQVTEDISIENNSVISTGGGIILKEENIINLKLNGKIYFIDRDISKIVPTEERPLSKNKDMLLNLFNKRYEIYKNSCDVRVTNNEELNDVTEKIISDFERIE